MTIKIKSEAELLTTCEKLIHIIVNMRYYQKIWHVHYGSTNKGNKDYWEKNADELINSWNMQNVSVKRLEKINIEIMTTS